MNSLKHKTINGILWSGIDSFANQGLLFIIGIILARLLIPKEFGLIGMITIFIAVSESIINSGFSQALIRKKECTEADLSTVFYFNMVAGIIFFGILFMAAPAISRFFDEPQLKGLVRVLGLVLIIDALTIIQRTTLTKRIDFKLQTKVSVIANICSGIVGISMAFTGFGVWSLIAKTLSQRGLNSFLLWLWNKWRPVLVFSKRSFIELFSFGSKLLVSGLIDTLYRNIYYLVIGKYFSAQELGYYTRADQFNNLPSKNINGIISRVSYPVLAKLQDDPGKLKTSYRKIIKSTMFVTFILMFGLAAIAEPLILTLVGEKWQSSVIYLQLLSFAGMMYPLHSLNLDILNINGRSDLFLRLEIIKKALAIPVILISVLIGIKAMIIGMNLHSLICYFINSRYSGRLINYPVYEQIRDISPTFFVAFLIGGIVFSLNYLIGIPPGLLLIIQLLVGLLLAIAMGEFAKLSGYFEIKEIVLERISFIKK
jgi:O-antigen/teichoic acid export membrane protein